MPILPFRGPAERSRDQSGEHVIERRRVNSSTSSMDNSSDYKRTPIAVPACDREHQFRPADLFRGFTMAEIGAHQARITCNVGCASFRDDASRAQHIAAVRDGERHAGVLLHEENRHPLRAVQFKDKDQASELFSRLVQANHAAAFDNLSGMYPRERKDTATAITLFKRGSALDDADSTVSLVDLLDKGLVATPNPVEAKLALLHRVDGLGHAGAQRGHEVELQKANQERINQVNQQQMMQMFGALVRGVVRIIRSSIGEPSTSADLCVPVFRVFPAPISMRPGFFGCQRDLVTAREVLPRQSDTHPFQLFAFAGRYGGPPHRCLCLRLMVETHAHIAGGLAGNG
jgi:hypothetical protein